MLKSYVKTFLALTLSVIFVYSAASRKQAVEAQRKINETSPAATSSTNAAISPTPTPIEDDEVVRVDTEEVTLNVRVVDGKNRSINHLGETNFQVYEDGILQPITSFATAEMPTVNTLLIDNSRSLRFQLDKVIEAGKIIVGTNRPKDETAVVRFVDNGKIEVVQDFTANKNSLGNALDNLYVEGGQTAIIDAVYQTAKKVAQYQNSPKPDDVKLRALVLVSDGDDRSSTHSEQQLVELLRRLDVQIYAVGFTSDLSKTADGANRKQKAQDFLTRLAEETGGKVYFPDSTDELAKIAAEISGELRTQYLLSYAPTNDAHDGTFRKIKVVVSSDANAEKCSAITRAGRTSASK